MKNIKLYLIFITILIILTLSHLIIRDNDISVNKNLINKVNAIEQQWINYEGENEYNNKMVKTQFIPYQSNKEYILNNDAYVSYYNGDTFIKTELHEGDYELKTVEEADGVILSFNKANKNGIKLVTTD